MQLQDTNNVIKVNVFLTMEISLNKFDFRYIPITKEHYRYSYDTIDIFQKLSDYYASSNVNI